MVEYNEDDLAREMEEMKNTMSAKSQTTQDVTSAAEGIAPKRRAPPRRTTGSSNLAVFGAS
jgi:hypothetical protein